MSTHLAPRAVPGIPTLDAHHLGADIRSEMDTISGLYDERGLVLLRGLTNLGPEFDTLVEEITGESTLTYEGGATPRSRVRGRVYTSTDFPAHASIDMHSEMAYARTWPLTLAFYCATAATTGGATPVAPTDAILERLPGTLVSDLLNHGITYRRCFDPILGTDWSDAYGTTNRDELPAKMAERGERLETSGDRVVSSITLPATLDIDGTILWFNQAVAYNAATLPDDVRQDLVDVVGIEGIPKNSFVGDGRPFLQSEIDAIRSATDAVRLAFPWEVGDLLLVDNRRWAHGRDPYTGARAVQVCMTGVNTWSVKDRPIAASRKGNPHAHS